MTFNNETNAIYKSNYLQIYKHHLYSSNSRNIHSCLQYWHTNWASTAHYYRIITPI